MPGSAQNAVKQDGPHGRRSAAWGETCRLSASGAQPPQYGLQNGGSQQPGQGQKEQGKGAAPGGQGRAGGQNGRQRQFL